MQTPNSRVLATRTQTRGPLLGVPDKDDNVLSPTRSSHWKLLLPRRRFRADRFGDITRLNRFSAEMRASCSPHARITACMICICNWTHTYIYIYTYMNIHTCMHAYIHIHILIHIHTHTYIYIYTYTYIDIYIYIHARIYIHINRHACIHRRIHIYIHTCIHAYVHMYIHTCVSHAYINRYTRVHTWHT